MNSCDILILGGGLAGLNARAEIEEISQGKLAVILCDKGGAASSEIMGFSAPVNPPDSPDKLYEDTLAAGKGYSDPLLVRLLADRAIPEMRRLEAMGIRFDRLPDGTYDTVHALGTGFGRVVHSGTGTGKQAMELLSKIPVLKKRAVKLLKTISGAIAGARFEDGSEIRAKAVIVCGGGFAGLWKFSTWNKNLCGDALLLGADAGATLVNLPFVQFEPTVTSSGFPIITTVLNEGARLLDRHGNNILKQGEKLPAKRELALKIQQVIDSGNGFDDGTVRYDFSGLDEKSFASRYPGYYRKYKGDASSFAGLSFQVRPGAHTTLGGIRISPDCSVPEVPGLFCAGEAAGNLHGRDRLGGNAGLEVFVFGRIAGKSAAEYASKDQKFQLLYEDPENAVIHEEYRFYAELLNAYFSVNSTITDYEDALEIMRGIGDSPLKRFVTELFTQAIAL